MDSQNNAPSPSPYSDPFNIEQQDVDDSPAFPLQSPNRPQLATPIHPPTTATRQLNGSSTPAPTTHPASHPFTSPSPSPSTPAILAFNPDDFFASPPQQPPNTTLLTSAERFTPELKRRLFCPSDSLLSTINTTDKKSTHPIPLHTPIPKPSFSSATRPQPTPDHPQSHTISPNLSSPPSASANTLSKPDLPPQSNTTQIGLKKDVFMAHAVQPLPGTPFTPANPSKCSCKASRCLKLYCPCFARSGYCGEGCTCKNCQNTSATSFIVRDARQNVLTRDPRAFEPKVRNSQAAANGDIHTKGCNCRKGCGKNYCVCRELKVDCGPRCTCSGPKGCLNGKNAAGSINEAEPSSEQIFATPRLGPSPERYRTGLPPTKPVRSRGSALAGALRQDKKRLKQDTRQVALARVSSLSSPHILSPSFPSLNMDVSPTMSLRDNLEDYRNVMGAEEALMTPFALRRGQSLVGFRTPDQNRKSPGHMDHNGSVQLGSLEFPGLEGNASPGPLLVSRPRTRSRLLTQTIDRDMCTPTRKIAMTGIGQSFADEKALLRPFSKSRGSSSSAHIVKRNLKDGGEQNGKEGAKDKSRTPETTPRLPDMDFGTSPATAQKETTVSTWGNYRDMLFGREDRVEIPRLPRILRVKMGSGRQLRKTDV